MKSYEADCRCPVKGAPCGCRSGAARAQRVGFVRQNAAAKAISWAFRSGWLQTHKCKADVWIAPVPVSVHADRADVQQLTEASWQLPYVHCPMRGRRGDFPVVPSSSLERQSLSKAVVSAPSEARFESSSRPRLQTRTRSANFYRQSWAVGLLLKLRIDPARRRSIALAGKRRYASRKQRFGLTFFFQSNR